MIRRLNVHEANGYNPYRNLAIEQRLLETVEANTVTLYLWQNENTVVIGRNQNAWKECRTDLLEAEGGRLARRLSGGGAVYHDLGNLNFTFLVPTESYDLDRQLNVILSALRHLGMEAERSGRNDVLCQGRKVSGNAFYRQGERSYHHGTLLVRTDVERMQRYLNPSPLKWQGKGVDSVRSRVGNLTEYAPDVTILTLKQALLRAFSEEYGMQAERVSFSKEDEAEIQRLTERNGSFSWNYGSRAPCSVSLSGRFLWGSLTVELSLEKGRIERVQVYSDAMDWSLPETLQAAWSGVRFSSKDMMEAVKGLDETVHADVETLLKNNGI